MKFQNITSGLTSPAQWLIDWVRGPESDSGVSVTVNSALGHPPIWYAVNKIAGDIGKMPLNLHRRLPRGSEHASEHPLYSLMRDRPNEWQTAIAFKEQLLMHALLVGNGRAAIVRKNGMVSELIPLAPNRTYTCIVDGEKWHIINCADDRDTLANPESLRPFSDSNPSSVYKLHDRDVVHIPGLSYDGVSGYSLIQIARDSIGLGLAAQKASSRSFKNGARPGIVLKAPATMFRDEKDAKEFLENFNNFHEGPENIGRAALMREGMDIETIAMSASDSQWIQQRQFQRQDSALLFALESILGDDSSVSYNSLEQKNLAYLQGLSRWMAKCEQECNYKLLSNRDRRSLYFKFNEKVLLRTDAKTQMDTLTGYIAARVMNPNEARELLERNPYDGGDEFENPAISPGTPGDESQQMTVEDTNRAAIVSHLQHIMKVESRHIESAAKTKRNFIGWLDSFYGEKWANTMRRTLDLFGADESLAVTYCESAKTELLEIAGTVNADGLPDAIGEVVAHWPNRAESLTETILKRELTDATL